MKLPDKQLSIKATQLFLMAVGGCASVAFLGSLSFWILPIGVLFAVGTWSLIYLLLWSWNQPEQLEAPKHD